jgi:hypothetical protein
MGKEPTQDILSHGPKLNSDTGNLCEIRRRAVFKEGGVGNLSRSPFTLVVWVGDLGDGPFTLVFGVSDLGGGPWSTSSTVFTFRVGYHGWDPISILLILSVSCATEILTWLAYIPFLGLLGFWIGDGLGLVLEPILRLGSRSVDDHQWCVLVPVRGLLSVRNAGQICLGLTLVAEVSSISARSTQVSGLKSSGSSTHQPLDQERSTKLTNLSRRVDSRVKVLQQASLPDRLIIDQDLESLIRVDNQSV